MDTPEERPDASRADALTRAERRQQRQEAARQRMPQHGRGMGVMVRNAILRRIKDDESPGRRG
ncbi:MAG TPA: hypothetical protein VIU62_13035 [Chloroflexota bacterium]|jgi:hypothetical protein